MTTETKTAIKKYCGGRSAGIGCLKDRNRSHVFRAVRTAVTKRPDESVESVIFG
jgi:hypothetical protein